MTDVSKQLGFAHRSALDSLSLGKRVVTLSARRVAKNTLRPINKYSTRSTTHDTLVVNHSSESLASYITVKMSENQAGQHSYTPRCPLDPRLDEWPQDQFPSIQSGRQCDHDQGQSQKLPPISPYNTEYLSKQGSLNNVCSSEARAYVSVDLFSCL